MSSCYFLVVKSNDDSLTFFRYFSPIKSRKRIVFVNVTIAVSDENFHASYQLNIGSNFSTV